MEALNILMRLTQIAFIVGMVVLMLKAEVPSPREMVEKWKELI